MRSGLTRWRFQIQFHRIPPLGRRTPLSRIPFAPRLAASALGAAITAFVLPCAVIEKGIPARRVEQRNFFVLAGRRRRYICTRSGKSEVAPGRS